MKNKKYHIRTKSNRKIVETEAKSIHLIHTYMNTP